LGEFNIKPYFVAIDFDGTLCAGGFPNIERGRLIDSTARKMFDKVKKVPQTVFILWTCRTGARLEEAKQFIKQHNLPIYYFNENHPTVAEFLQTQDLNSPKIFANEYWDDRAVAI
jgi:hypothetical protein